VAQHDIDLIPLRVHIGGKRLLDDFDFTPDELFAEVEANGELPKTSAPSVGEFLEHFEDGDQSLYIGISSQLSASVGNARIAAQTLSDGHTRVIDSRTLSSGIGLLALLAADLRDAGHTLDDIERRIRAAVPRVKISFVIDTMDYLYKGGRCSALQHLAGSLLKLHPVIHALPDGTLDVKRTLRGSRNRALRFLLDDFEANVESIDLRRVFVTHSAYPEGTDELTSALAEMAPIETLLVTEAGAVVSSHCGPKTIGILYMTKSA
jgi:DegV family protein with EDD domain